MLVQRFRRSKRLFVCCNFYWYWTYCLSDEIFRSTGILHVSVLSAVWYISILIETPKSYCLASVTSSRYILKCKQVPIYQFASKYFLHSLCNISFCHCKCRRFGKINTVLSMIFAKEPNKLMGLWYWRKGDFFHYIHIIKTMAEFHVPRNFWKHHLWYWIRT